MGSHILETQWARVADQLAEHAAAPGQWADLAARLLIDAGVQEALEPALLAVQDPQCRVLRAGQVASGIDNPAKQGFQVQLGDDRSPDFEQLPESLIREVRLRLVQPMEGS